jgi:putative transposase
MRERTEKDESIDEFCTRLGISRNKFFYWQRKLREAASRELTPLAVPEREAIVPRGWAVCEPEEEGDKAASTVTIEIGKCRITATTSTDPDLLAKVCGALTRQC